MPAEPGTARGERSVLELGWLVGKTRRVRLDRDDFAREELASYLERLADAAPELREAANRLRRRPRVTGKPP